MAGSDAPSIVHELTRLLNSFIVTSSELWCSRAKTTSGEFIEKRKCWYSICQKKTLLFVGQNQLFCETDAYVFTAYRCFSIPVETL